jgi:hypothetical protein
MGKRRAPRLRTLKGGSIIFGLAAAVDCVIRNKSATSAALEVESPVGIPDEVTLLIKPEFTKRSCKVAWRSAKRPGREISVSDRHLHARYGPFSSQASEGTTLYD